MKVAGEKELGVELEDAYLARLAAYARAVSHFPTAVKEFPWRNGWFCDLSVKGIQANGQDPLPLHTALLRELGHDLPPELL